MLCAVVSVVKTISPPTRNMLPTGAVRQKEKLKDCKIALHVLQVVTERLQLLEISAKVFFMLISLVKVSSVFKIMLFLLFQLL